MDVERGQQRAAGLTGHVRVDIADARLATTGSELPVEVTRLEGRAARGGDRKTTIDPGGASIDPPGGLLQAEVPHQFGIHGVLEQQHHAMTRIRGEVNARMPRPDETVALHLRPGVPVLDVWHTSIDQDGQPYELTRFVMRGDMTGLLYDVPVE
jgi:hypothetical protein